MFNCDLPGLDISEGLGKFLHGVYALHDIFLSRISYDYYAAFCKDSLLEALIACTTYFNTAM
jgi:hypothetical protein